MLRFLTRIAQPVKLTGLEELGLFRPYRWAEDMSRQRRLQNLFLKSIETELLAPSEHSNGEDPAQDLLSATHKPAELLAEELQCAGVHDLSALIRWVSPRIQRVFIGSPHEIPLATGSSSFVLWNC